MSAGAPAAATVRIVQEGPVRRLVLSRPEVRNAFDDRLIAEMTEAVAALSADPETRVAILEGDGPSFCAGADIAWMRKAGSYSREENEADARRLAAMLQSLDTCPRPVVAAVHGHAIGGGVGLVAAADIAVAAEGTIFSLAEVKLGILAAVISPYVLRAIGARQARDLFLTGDRFDAREALRIGLVHQVVPAEELGAAVRRKVDSLLTSGPEALVSTKRLIERVARLSPEEAMTLTVRTIAERRASEEAREGLSAFLEKRLPRWGVRKPS
jgi:methylglutaconyl-CoA hydratase